MLNQQFSEDHVVQLVVQQFLAFPEQLDLLDCYSSLWNLNG